MTDLRTAASLFAAALLLSACASAPKSTKPGDPLPLTVISYNIRIGVGPDSSWGGAAPLDNMAAIADWIIEQDADLVLLQEVDRGRSRTGGMDQPGFLADATGMQVKYAPAIEGDGEYGIAVLSRFPVSDSERVFLPRPDYSQTHPDLPDWYAEQRVAQGLTVETPAGPVRVVNTHLGVTKDQRGEQAAMVAELAEDAIGDSLPVIVGGDFNAEPGTPEMLPVLDVLRDCYHGFTSENGLEYDMSVVDRLTFPQDEPDRCIDYLFVSPGDFTVLETTVPDVRLSDHRPVVSRVVVKP